MKLDERLRELWGEASKDEPAPLCPFAEAFSEWAGELLASTLEKPSVVSLNQAKILLLDKYFDWRACVPKRHRFLGGQGGSHTCIFHIFEMNYERLKVVELALKPPPLFVPELSPAALPAPPSISAPAPQIAGIFLGEEE